MKILKNIAIILAICFLGFLLWEKNEQESYSYKADDTATVVRIANYFKNEPRGYRGTKVPVSYTKLYLSNGLAYDFEGTIDVKEGEVIRYHFEREEEWGDLSQSISDVEIVGKDDTAKFTKHKDYKIIEVEYTDTEE